MIPSFRLGGLIAIGILGAGAMALAFALSRDPQLLRRLVRQGAVSYHKAMSMLAEVREELGDLMAEGLQQAEDELRQQASEDMISDDETSAVADIVDNDSSDDAEFSAAPQR